MAGKLSAQHCFPRAFLAKIPKADLHLHLDGSLRLTTLIELAKKEGVALPAYTPQGLQKTVFKEKYKNLGEYLRGFSYTTAVMQRAENIERIAYELARDCLAEGVRYIEVRFAPQLHYSYAKKLTPDAAVRAAARGLRRAQREHNQSAAVKSGTDIEFHYGLILCAMRSFSRETSPYYAYLFQTLVHADKEQIFAIASDELARAAVALKKEGLPIVGFDLAGEEAGYPAEEHRRAYQYVHEAFIRKTVHAGEAYGPESIFQAITDCHANRIGHGTFLFDYKMIKDKKITGGKKYVEELASYIAGERIGVEVCITSNLQTLPSIKTVAAHPVGRMIKAGLSVSICTDNRLVSATSSTKELELLCNNIKLTQKQLRNIVIAGFKGSFFPGSYNDKRRFIAAVVARYDTLEAEYLK
ncbi:MAG: adenosine deaminase family protein [Elusimicrobiota bacterium]|jgi:adenosine deaminase|nr:adenosine deaminase family protein [Elusimicrobiota bacterium]